HGVEAFALVGELVNAAVKAAPQIVKTSAPRGLGAGDGITMDVAQAFFPHHCLGTAHAKEPAHESGDAHHGKRSVVPFALCGVEAEIELGTVKVEVVGACD